MQEGRLLVANATEIQGIQGGAVLQIDPRCNKCLQYTVMNWKEIARIFSENTAGIPSNNIELCEVTKIANRKTGAFVQTNEFAI